MDICVSLLTLSLLTFLLDDSSSFLLVLHPCSTWGRMFFFFADCKETNCHLVMGGILFHGTWVCSWSKTQPTVALSSAEAELSGICTGASTALGLQSVGRDLAIELVLDDKTDATAAIGICKRQGLGRVRHLATADLWVQQRVRDKEINLFKFPGKDNPRDLMTKYKSAPEATRFLEMVGIRPLAGRAELAPARIA